MKTNQNLKVYLLLVLTCLAAKAQLEELGNGEIFDPVHNTYWIQDLSLFGNLTYQQKLEMISDFNEPGSTAPLPPGFRWHMATRADLEKLWGVTFTSDPFTPEVQERWREITAVFKPAWTQGTYALYYAGSFDEIVPVDPGPGHNYATLLTGECCDGVVNGSGLISYVQGANDDAVVPMGAWVAATVIPEPTPGFLLLTGVCTLFLLRMLRGNYKANAKLL